MSSSQSKKWVCVRKIMFAVCASMLLLFACLPAFSQGGLGTIQGTITSAQGGPLGGATVSIVDVARGDVRPLTTSPAGLFSAGGLTPGAYTVRVEAKGFKTMEHTGITLTVGATLTVDFAMQAGAESEIVTITAEVLPIGSASMVDNKAISETPVNGRNFVNLVENRNTGQTTTPGGASNNRTSNGMRTDQNNPLIDGIYDGDIDTGWQNVNGFGFQGGVDPDILMPLDAIGEISANGFPPAAYGWHLGNVTNLGIKSGTNSFHGTAYAFGRDSDLDTRNPLRPPPGSGLVGAGKTAFALEQWGASMGGKIRKDKLFYFGNFEKEGFNVGQTQQIDTPTNADLTCALGTNICSGTTNLSTGFTATNSIPDAIFDALNNKNNCGTVTCTGANYTTSLKQVMLNMAGCEGLNATTLGPATTLNTIAAGCNTGGTNTGGLSVFNNSQNIGTNSALEAFGVNTVGGPTVGIGKIDYHLNKKHSFNGEYYFGVANALSERTPASTQGWWLIDSVIKMQIARGVWVYTPNSSIVNEARFGMDWVHELAQPSDCAGTNGAPYYPTVWGWNSGATPQGGAIGCEMPFVTESPFANLSFSPGAGPYTSQPRNYIGIDSVSWTRGKHVIKFGAEIRRGIFTGSGGGGTGPPIRGTIGFGTTPAFTGATTLEDILVGQNTTSTVFFGNGITSNVRANYYAGFLQDTYRLNKKTTIDLGVRYEFQPAYYQPQNQESTLNFGVQSLLGQESASQPLYHQDTWKHNFSPRYALSYDVFGNGRTVVRVAGGIMYAMTTYSGLSGMQNNPTGATFFSPQGANTTAVPCSTTFTGTSAPALDAGLCGFTNPYCNATDVGNSGTFTQGTGNVTCINQGTIQTSGLLNYNVCTPLGTNPNGLFGNVAGTMMNPGCTQAQTVFGGLLNNGTSGLRCGDALPTTVNGSVINPPTCTVYTINPNLYIPYVTNWTLSLQQSLGKAVSFNMTYVGNHGTAVRQQIDINQPAPGIANAATCPTTGPEAPALGTAKVYCANNLQARTPFTTNCAPGVIPAPAGTQYALFAGSTSGPCAPWLGQVLEVANSDVSNYDALLATLSLRAYHGFSGNLNYSLQHCLDIFSGNENIWTILSDTRDPRLDYSTCANGTPNRITGNWNWAIPGRKGFAQMLQGWSLNSTVTLLPKRYLAFTDTKDQLSGVITPGVTSIGSERWDIFGSPTNLKGVYGLGGTGSLVPCYAFTGGSFATASNGCATSTATTTAVINGTTFTVPSIGPQGICTTDALLLPNSPASALVPSGTVTNGSTSYPQNTALANLALLGCYVLNGTVMLPGAQGTFGDMSKNCCLGTGYFQMDMSLTKTWGFLKEQRLKMQFRVEAFNALNRTNYGSPSGGLGTPSTLGSETASLNAGSQVVTGVGGERQVQLGLKFIW